MEIYNKDSVKVYSIPYSNIGGIRIRDALHVPIFTNGKVRVLLYETLILIWIMT